MSRISPSSIDRLLHPYRRLGGRRPFTTTKRGSLLKKSIPIRTFADWEEDSPGFLEIDLVAHCGDSPDGLFLTTLTAVDVASGWSECIGVWGKGQQRVRSATTGYDSVCHSLCWGWTPIMAANSLTTTYSITAKRKITFTRSRSYKKNDSCHVEQKNWSVVRRLVGYDRYDSKAALEALNRVYNLTRLYVNFFQPNMKLVHKSRNGAKVHKFYDTAQTPYRRLLV